MHNIPVYFQKVIVGSPHFSMVAIIQRKLPPLNSRQLTKRLVPIRYVYPL